MSQAAGERAQAEQIEAARQEIIDNLGIEVPPVEGETPPAEEQAPA